MLKDVLKWAAEMVAMAVGLFAVVFCYLWTLQYLGL